ncbi:MAG TPA: shikimate kinase [Pyrinomonadaceae bacterium]|nr:shikimate kinase [Pyrinomonadaceae bacterium]
MIHLLIAITGFMASGKTTIARALAARLDYEFVDLDDLIAAQQQRTIKEIIETEGEDRFREIETNALGEVLRKDGARVIALGGGAWTMPENRRMLGKREALTVWLDTSFDLCWKGIEAGYETRPLASSREQAHQLYLERRPIYELAQKRIVCEGRDAVEIAEEIAASCLRCDS